LNLNRLNNLPIKKFDEKSFEELMNYNWPGNIKELENFIKRISVLYPESIITDTSIKNELNKSRETIKNDLNEFTETLDLEFEKIFNQENISQFSGKLYDYFIKKYEKSLIKKTLNSVNGNQIKASRLLGINRNTLRKKIIELEIEIIKRIKN
jgi:two-component system nitrogen regulation response regulator GlnG